jgi:hypothetical protein
MTTFKTSEIVSFLENNGYALMSKVFAEKFNIDRVEYVQVADWFKMNIIRDQPYMLFRKMEATIIQHTEL